MKYPIGVSSQEGVSSGATPFLEDDRYTIGLAMSRERGVPNKAILISSLQEDKKKFGGHKTGMYGSHVVEDLFNNVGSFGARYYGIRVVDATSLAASTGAVTYDSGVPVINNTLVIAHGAAIKAVRYVTFSTPSVADALTINGVTHTVTDASPYAIASAFAVALNQDATFAASYSAEALGAILVITAKAVNTAVTLVTSVVAADDDGVSLFTSVKAAQNGFEDPGTWGNDLQIVVYPFGVFQNDVFAVEVYYKGERVELYTGTKMGDVVSLINGNSEYVMINGYNAGHAPVTTLTKLLSGGTYVAPANEAAFYPVESDSAPISLGALAGLQVSLVACTEYFTNTMAATLLTFARTNRKIAIVVPPYLANTATLTGFATLLQTASTVSRHICVYNFWGEKSDGAGGWLWVPAIGAVLGAGWLRVPQMNFDQIHFAPAGVDSVVLGYKNVSPANLSQATIDDLITNKSINVTKTIPGTGTFLLSSRTMSTNPLYHSAHISRLTNYLLISLEKNFLKILQKPNTPETRAQVIGEVTQIFKTLYDDGALERSVPFEKAFQCICDTSNNPLGGDRKQLIVDINWIPSECIEAVRFRLNRNDGSLIITLTDAANAA